MHCILALMEKISLFLGAHPDDIETMLSGSVKPPAFACVATDGEGTTVNNTPYPMFIAERKRLGESTEGLERAGIPKTNQIYLHLPDGSLNRPDVFAKLLENLQQVIESHPFDHIYTLGAAGYDGHPDHIATHQAAVQVTEDIYSKTGRVIAIRALNESGGGTEKHPVKAAQKLHAMSAHKSQFKIRDKSEGAYPTGLNIDDLSVDADFWEYFKPYHTVITIAETYDVITPRHGANPQANDRSQ